ncbi:MAG TPA: DUF2231 domain-containing protein [Woeseiaceae bacterium]
MPRSSSSTRLHPPFLHFPIAFWVTGTALDVAQTTLGLSLPGIEGFALPHWLLWGGVIAALPTVAAGLADFASLPRAVQDSRALKRHMLCMSTAFTLFLVAAVWRVKAGAFAAPPPLMLLSLEILGVVALLVGGHAGGRVVFEELPATHGGGAAPEA